MPQQKQTGWPGRDPGELRHQIQIQTVSSTPDATGQPQQVWTTVWTCWAKIRSLTLREVAQMNQVTSRVTHMISVRYPCGISVQASMRIVFGTQIYKIQGVDNPFERNVWLDMTCLQIDAIE